MITLRCALDNIESTTFRPKKYTIGREAVRTVKPNALDICSGVRTDGDLDEKNWQDFLKRLEA